MPCIEEKTRPLGSTNGAARSKAPHQSHVCGTQLNGDSLGLVRLANAAVDKIVPHPQLVLSYLNKNRGSLRVPAILIPPPPSFTGNFGSSGDVPPATRGTQTFVRSLSGRARGWTPKKKWTKEQKKSRTCASRKRFLARYSSPLLHLRL